MPRKGENIRKRTDGRWEARYIKGYQADGKARYGYLYARTYAEVKQKKHEALTTNRLESLIPKGKCILLSGAMERWLESRRERVKHSTFCHYAYIIYNHLIPALGSCPLNKVTDALIEQYVQEKQRRGRLDGRGGLSPKTIADQVNLLHWVLRYAAAQKWIGQSMFSAAAPKVTKYTPEIFNDIDWMRLNRYVKEHLNSGNLGILVAMHTGLRIGEVCGLRFSDIDFASGTLTVSRTLLRVKNMDKEAGGKTKVIIEPPKTDCSRRKLPVAGFLLQLIQEQYKEAESPDSYIITGTARHLEPRAYYRKYQAVLKCCGIKEYTFHALRHSFATRCIEQGCDPKTLSEILGHASVKITLERYVHPSMRSKRAVMERLAETDLWSEIGTIVR